MNEEKAKLYVIVVAAGTGSRMKSSLPKQFLEVCGKPILMHTIQAFQDYSADIKIILVLSKQERGRWEELCAIHNFNLPITIVDGGNTRTESVMNGLKQISTNDGLVAIHDGVRPLVSQETIHQTFETAAINGAAIASVKLKDSIRKVESNKTTYLDRENFRLVQTPQTFSVALIKNAYRHVQQDFSDDATVAEMAGYEIHLVEGDYQNIKITTKEDINIAEALLLSKRAVSS